MVIIKKTILIITLCLTALISQSCQKDPLNDFEKKLDEMLKTMMTYGYELETIQTYESITTAVKKIDMRIDNSKDMMYLYIYELVISSFNQENTIFEITYFYESQMIYEDLGDVMTSRPGDKKELLSMTSLHIFQHIFNQVLRYDINSEGIHLYLKDSREIKININNHIITNIMFINRLELTTITQKISPFYENNEVFIPKYKLEATPV